MPTGSASKLLGTARTRKTISTFPSCEDRLSFVSRYDREKEPKGHATEQRRRQTQYLNGSHRLRRETAFIANTSDSGNRATKPSRLEETSETSEPARRASTNHRVSYKRPPERGTAPAAAAPRAGALGGRPLPSRPPPGAAPAAAPHRPLGLREKGDGDGAAAGSPPWPPTYPGNKAGGQAEGAAVPEQAVTPPPRPGSPPAPEPQGRSLTSETMSPPRPTRPPCRVPGRRRCGKRGSCPCRN